MVDVKQRQSVASTGIWWRSFELPAGSLQNFQIGPTRLQIAHLDREWRIAASRIDDHAGLSLVNHVAIDDPVPATASLLGSIAGASSEVDATRYATRRTSAGFRLAPVLADRPVICRPLSPLFVMPGDHIELFMSTPVWISVYLNALSSKAVTNGGVNGDEGTHVADIPAVHLNDTWIGGSTVDGEIGYASLTKARLAFDDVKPKPHMAVTGVVVRNLAAKPLRIERLSLPAPWLHVFATASGTLCTEGILLEHREGAPYADLEIMNQPLTPGEKCERIGRARHDTEQRSAARASGRFNFANLIARIPEEK